MEKEETEIHSKECYQQWLQIVCLSCIPYPNLGVIHFGATFFFEPWIWMDGWIDWLMHLSFPNVIGMLENQEEEKVQP